jgi:hypothetical protein
MKHLTYNVVQPDKSYEVSQVYAACLAGGRGGEIIWYKLPAPSRTEVCPGIEYVAYVCLPGQYRYVPVVQINPFTPRASHFATERQSFRFILFRPCCVG